MDQDLPELDDDLTDADWLSALDACVDPQGSFEPLGPDHAAAFIDTGPTLIVSFEETRTIRARRQRLPIGMTVAVQRRWSSLTLLTTGQTWWRADPVYGYFDRLCDDGFFDDFDQVVFYGAGMGGYAAAAYSVAAPGATVVLAAPQATLAPSATGWDARFRAHRRLNFSDRYGYAPDMAEAAQACFVLFDPLYHPDAIHAALFHGPATQMVPLRHFGAELPCLADQMGLVEAAILAAGDRHLDMTLLYELARLRRGHKGWLRNMQRAALSKGADARADVVSERLVNQRMTSGYAEVAGHNR